MKAWERFSDGRIPLTAEVGLERRGRFERDETRPGSLQMARLNSGTLKIERRKTQVFMGLIGGDQTMAFEL